jgi:hypothetical protein
MMETKCKPKEMEIDVVFGDGTKRRVKVHPSAVNWIKYFAGASPEMLEGTGANQIISDLSNIVSISRSDHEQIHSIGSARSRAAFRLGQMDMQASACAMLRKMADAAAPSLSTGLNIAADLVEELEVMNADA